MKKLNCLLVHNGLKKCSPSNAGTSPTLRTIFPQILSPYGYGSTPGACSPQSLPCALPWRHFLFETEGIPVFVPTQMCTLMHGHMCAHTYTHTHTRFVHFTRSSGKSREILPRIPSVWVLQWATEWARLCMLKGEREQCFLNNYYDHHHCHYSHSYLIVMMVLIIWICIML